jgi:Mg2+ and Co2+ transporter CorA
MTTPQEQLEQIERDIEAVRAELLDAFDERRLACETQLRELLELREELLKSVRSGA